MTEQISAAPSANPYKVTLKGGSEYDAPWVTVEGRTAAELAFNLKALGDQGVFPDVAAASTAMQQAVHGVNTAADVLGGQPVYQPPQQPSAPAAQPADPWVSQAPPPDWAQGPAQQPAQPQQQQWQQPQQQGAPQQEQRGQKRDTDFVGKGGHWPPAGPRPTCRHGERDWKSFTAKSGKLTEMWACPFDRQGAFIPPGESKCDVEWANNR